MYVKRPSSSPINSFYNSGFTHLITLLRARSNRLTIRISENAPVAASLLIRADLPPILLVSSSRDLTAIFSPILLSGQLLWIPVDTAICSLRKIALDGVNHRCPLCKDSFSVYPVYRHRYLSKQKWWLVDVVPIRLPSLIMWISNETESLVSSLVELRLSWRPTIVFHLP